MTHVATADVGRHTRRNRHCSPAICHPTQRNADFRRAMIRGRGISPTRAQRGPPRWLAREDTDDEFDVTRTNWIRQAAVVGRP
jgi:hypothetical protein